MTETTEPVRVLPGTASTPQPELHRSPCGGDDVRRAPPVAGTDAMDAEFKKVIVQGCDALRIEIPEVLVDTMVAEASGRASSSYLGMVVAL